ncbi:hypothetical protein [Nitrosococcus oceani]|uniref:hypothetical protein n=1 Tax=Nitrosococcus oceani TaxID=1229 RepID=UPI000183C2B1|nr:hypothetical protein [Nitrosococcus oceani]EDZ67159.1 hypothetical protein NOC27_486 [Nitrosococcus oceani AFC27]GEM20633.1 hypothetical protein NONS58_20520 [Nitrosococcus oceani]
MRAKMQASEVKVGKGSVKEAVGWDIHCRWEKSATWRAFTWLVHRRLLPESLRARPAPYHLP